MAGDDERQELDVRLVRVEEAWKHVGQQVDQRFTEIKGMISDLVQEIRTGYIPRDVAEERFKAVAERFTRLEARVRDLGQRPMPKPEEPGWTKILIALVSILGASLVTLVVTMAIYYQAKP